jgi:hypothetical protein
MIKKYLRKKGGIAKGQKATVIKKKAPKKSAAPKKAVQKKTSKITAKKATAPKRKILKTAKTAGVSKRRPVRVSKVSTLEELISKVKAPEKPNQEERKIEESKYDIGVPHNGKAVPSYDIPLEYNVDRAIVLTVDPRLVFAYWEVRQQSIYDAMSKVGAHAKLTLRFYDISATGDPSNSPSWDVEVFDRLGNWYLRLDYPEQVLCLDVGLKNQHGVFYCVARSNIIKIPRQFLAAPGPLKWMVVSPDGQKIITDVEEYTEADLQLLRKILGPHFFDLLMRGQFASIAGSSLEAVFQEISSLRVPLEVSSSPSSWSRHP